MHEEVVVRRKWISAAEFLDMVAATNLIPGPNSTEMAIQIGCRRGGHVGLLVAGACFITPAAVLVGGIAWFYVRYGALPQVLDAFYAIKPIVIVIILKAVLDLARTAIKSTFLAILALGAAAANLAGFSELPVLFLSGFAALGARKLRGAAPAIVLAPAAAAGWANAGAWPLFVYFLKVGGALYGSGYVLIALLQTDLVDRMGWITEQQLLDAVAVGQITPGPIFTTATFIGYLLMGFWGAVLATIGVFIPSFLLVAATQPLVRRARQIVWMQPFLDGINAAAVALMLMVAWQLSRAAIFDLPTAAIAGVSGVLIAFFRVRAAWLVLAALAIGLLWGLF